MTKQKLLIIYLEELFFLQFNEQPNYTKLTINVGDKKANETKDIYLCPRDKIQLIINIIKNKFKIGIISSVRYDMTQKMIELLNIQNDIEFSWLLYDKKARLAFTPETPNLTGSIKDGSSFGEIYILCLLKTSIHFKNRGFNCIPTDNLLNLINSIVKLAL